jgi:hypothetical protein
MPAHGTYHYVREETELHLDNMNREEGYFPDQIMEACHSNPHVITEGRL